jgi:hypothetical protein
VTWLKYCQKGIKPQSINQSAAEATIGLLGENLENIKLFSVSPKSSKNEGVKDESNPTLRDTGYLNFQNKKKINDTIL